MKTLFLSLVFALIVAVPARAQFFADSRHLGDVREVRVDIVDEVADGCAPDDATLKAEAVSILEQSDISVSDTPALGDVLTFKIIGGRKAGDMCVASLDASVRRVVPTAGGGKVTLLLFQQSILVTDQSEPVREALAYGVLEATMNMATQVMVGRSR